MKMNSFIFAIGFAIAFAGGYFIFGGNGSEANISSIPEPIEKSTSATNAEQGDTTDDNSEKGEVSLEADTEVLARNNCLSCHAVEGASLDGGTTGPDLSNVYNDVEGKHGKTLDEFLQDPTSAVMSSVMGENPLDKEEREEIVKLLKEIAVD